MQERGPEVTRCSVCDVCVFEAPRTYPLLLDTGATSTSVRRRRYPVRTSTGSKMATVSKLNMSWTVAPATARAKFSALCTCVTATIVLVTEVPMFAPMMM